MILLWIERKIRKKLNHHDADGGALFFNFVGMEANGLCWNLVRFQGPVLLVPRSGTLPRSRGRVGEEPGNEAASFR